MTLQQRYRTVNVEVMSMQTRDGVRLDADVYRPEGLGPFPVLLMRQPYGRGIASTVCYAHPSWYASHGYIVVIQDVRGRGTSQGKFQPYIQEINDGADAVIWAAELPDSTGKVGMYGFSYQGMSQILAAAASDPALVTICPAMIAYDIYNDYSYEGGAFRLARSIAYGLQLGAETARLAGDVEAHQAMVSASRDLPLHDVTPAYPDVLKKYARYTPFADWVAHPKHDAYWESISPGTYLDNVRIPALHVGGWFDNMLTGTIATYRELAASRDAGPQRLVVGPWEHFPWGRYVGAMDFGPSAAQEMDRLQLRWLDYWLKGEDTGVLDEAPVQLFEMGSNRWLGLDDWPADPPSHWYLGSTGLAGASKADGTLSLDPAEGAAQSAIVHDPWRPVPSRGGHAAAPGGPADRSTVDERYDVLTYTTAPLDFDLHLAGGVRVALYCRSDHPSFDVSAVLSQVYPDGRSVSLTQTYFRVQPGMKTTPLELSMPPTCCLVPRGHALRLSIAGACFPAYDVNTGHGTPPAEARLIDQEVISLTVGDGRDLPSCLMLTLNHRATEA